MTIFLFLPESISCVVCYWCSAASMVRIVIGRVCVRWKVCCNLEQRKEKVLLYLILGSVEVGQRRKRLFQVVSYRLPISRLSASEVVQESW